MDCDSSNEGTNTQKNDQTPSYNLSDVSQLFTTKKPRLRGAGKERK